MHFQPPQRLIFEIDAIAVMGLDDSRKPFLMVAGQRQLELRRGKEAAFPLSICAGDAR